MAPADIGLGGLLGIRLVLALLQLNFVEAGAQHVPGLGPVLVLRALLLAGHRDAGRDMRDAHGRIRRVDVLAAGPLRPIGVDAAVRFVDVDDDAVVDDGIDPDRRKRGLASRIGVEGRDAHQPVHARFGLQPAIGVMALELERRRLDAGRVAVLVFERLDLELPPLAPAPIHAQQHLGPVLALGAARAGMDLDIGVEHVGLAGEQGLDLEARRLVLHGLDRLLALGDGGVVAFHLAELDQRQRVIELAFELDDALDLGLQRGALAHQLLRGFGIVPKIGPLGEGVEFR